MKLFRDSGACLLTFLALADNDPRAGALRAVLCVRSKRLRSFLVPQADPNYLKVPSNSLSVLLFKVI